MFFPQKTTLNKIGFNYLVSPSRGFKWKYMLKLEISHKLEDLSTPSHVTNVWEMYTSHKRDNGIACKIDPECYRMEALRVIAYD